MTNENDAREIEETHDEEPPRETIISGPPGAATCHGDTSEPLRVIPSRRTYIRPRPVSQKALRLAKKLQEAAEELLDSLVAHLSALPDANDLDEDDVWVPHARTRSTSTNRSPRPGITLPASAVGWLATRIYAEEHPYDSNTQDRTFAGGMDDTSWTDDFNATRMRDKLQLLTRLLPRVTHLRIHKSDDWLSGLLSNARQALRRNQETETPHDNSADNEHEALKSYIEALVHRPRVDLSLFSNCQVLLLDQVPPERIYNLHCLRKSLQVLRIERCCIYDVDALFRRSTFLSDDNSCHLPSESHDDTVFCFSRLTHIKLARCELNDYAGLGGRRAQQQSSITRPRHPPLSRIMHLTSVSLANNQLSSQRSIVAGLANKVFLTSLDLSFNHLRSAKLLATHLRNLTTLNLSHNQLTHTHGIDQLIMLQTLHIDYNQISDIAHMANVARLSELRRLDISGNPLERRRPRGVRVDVLDLFREQRLPRLPPNASFRQLQQELPLLDGRLATLGELKAIRDRTFLRTDAIVFAVAEESWVRVEQRQDLLDGSSNLQKSRVHQSRRRPRRRATIETSFSEAQTNRITLQELRLHPEYQPLISFTLVDVLTALSPPTAVADEHVLDAVESDTVPQNDADAQDSTGVAAHLSPAFIYENQTQDIDVSQDVVTLEVVADSNGVNYIDDDDDDDDDDEHTVENEASLAAEESAIMSQEDIITEAAAVDEVVGISASCREATDEWQPSAKDGDVPAMESAFNFSGLSPIKLESFKEDELKASAATIASTLDALEEARSVNASPQPGSDRPDGEPIDMTLNRHGALSPSGQESDHSSSQPSQSPFQQNFRHVASFGGFVNDESLNNMSFGSPKTERADAASSKKGDLQQAETNSVYDGPKLYASITILENLDLYFRAYVFGGRGTHSDESFSVLDQYPKIQLWSIDRRYRDGVKEKARLAGKITLQEELRSVWQEKVIACGHPALRRLTPNRAARYGFHGELLWSAANTTHLKPETIAENRDVIICLTDVSLYIILDHDSVTEKTKDQKRAFPLPIPRDATFDKATWPHALAYHPLQTLKSISIGFGFQRLTLRFANTTFPVPDDFSYVLLTSSKSKTISLLKEIQSLANEAKSAAALAITDSEVVIDNDDRHVLDSLGAAVAPDQIGSVIHYQILSQRWKKGDRGIVRRVCVVTDAKLYLLDEDYVGDGSESIECGPGQTLGDTMYRMVDSAELQQVIAIQAADADPVAITISINPLNRLARTHNWRLVCRDRIGAERLVEDLRKAIALAV